MAITRTDIAQMLERNIRVGFLNGMKTYTPLRSAFCGETGSDGAFEQYGDMGDAPWPILHAGQRGYSEDNARTGAPVVGGLTEGGSIQVVGGNQRALDVYNLDWRIAVGITHSAIDDNRVGNLEEWARMAGQKFEKHRDYLAFQALNDGEATTNWGPSYDKLSLFNDSHIDPGSANQTAQDNKFSLSLDYLNFNTVYDAVGAFKGDDGQPVGYEHDLVIHARELRSIAYNICENPERYNTADGEMNPNMGTNRLQAPGGWLDSTAWFLVASSEIIKPIYMQEREAGRLVVWDDEAAEVRYFKWKARYTPFYGNWRLIAQGKS